MPLDRLIRLWKIAKDRGDRVSAIFLYERIIRALKADGLIR